jgi:ubiquinone/menaquinone biosynthesis C-methylase UbiE
LRTYLITLIVVLLAVVFIGLLWRLASRRWALPCPSWLVPLLENPYVGALAGSRLLLDRAGVAPGMSVLDVGSGPGRLTLPAAARVGATGFVLAMDIQPAMIRRLEQRMAEQGATNVKTLLAGVGEGKLEPATFDRVFLVTVLGELLEPNAALREIHEALEPGGILSVTELLPDPHYRSRRKVRRLAEEAGFHFVELFGSWLSFTMNVARPDDTSA